ncbi:MAG: hypothetical protein IJT44_11005 [Clostridia bacterium]|nr:hypothetical protein [Clostridia bacterium]
MRLYLKPELNIELFDVEDCIVMSDNGPIGDMEDWAPAPMPSPEDPGVQMVQPPQGQAQQSTLYPYSTVAEPSGAFQQQVTGGNPIQEGLNNLYENFLNRF